MEVDNIGKIIDEYKDKIVYIKNPEIRKCIKHLLMKSPKWYFTIDNKAFQKNTIKVINFALKSKKSE